MVERYRRAPARTSGDWPPSVVAGPRGFLERSSHGGIAEHHAGRFPDDAHARARAITWMFAALNTVEPPILELVTAKILEGDRPGAEERLPLVNDRIRDRQRYWNN
jgi:hypothetical protein